MDTHTDRQPDSSLPRKHLFCRFITRAPHHGTRHNLADSVPTSNLVCIKEVAIRTTFCIAGIIYNT